MPKNVAVAIAPADDPRAGDVAVAVERGGGTLVEPEAAEAIVWLGGSGQDLRTVLHDGIRWVQLASAGVEHWLNTGEIDDKRVFTSAAGAYAQSVGEHAVGFLLAAARQFPQCMQYDDWDRARGEGRPLRGATVGIIGAGGIGKEVIRLLQPFNVRIIAVTRSGRTIEGADLSISSSETFDHLDQMDYAVVAAPATSGTEALIGKKELDRLPKHAWVVNVGRGSLVDTEALVTALQDGSIEGAALDVTEPEPLPKGHVLWSMANVIITPHASNPDRDQTILSHIEANVARFAEGEELAAVVNVAAGY